MRILPWLLLWLQLCHSVTGSAVSFRNRREGPTILQLKTNEEPKDEKEELTATFRSVLDRLPSKRLTCQIPKTYVIAAGAIAAVVKGISSDAVRRAFFFWKHASPIIVHYKFTQWWLDASKADRAKRDQIYNKLHDRYCEPSLNIILNLKGLYVKIGQVLSSRPDFIPPQYIELFSTVQDAIPQWPIEQVRAIVCESLRNDFGLEWEDVFESMDEIALGSASIGQVHRAVLKDDWAKTEGYDGGKVAAVKVMHPRSKTLFAHDFQVFRWLCRLVLPDWKGLLRELERRMMTEFDYRNEAASLRDVRKNVENSPYRYYVCVPRPLEDLCCEHVLFMEMLNGTKLVDAIEDRLASALGGNHELATEFLERRQKEIFTHHSDESSDFIIESASLWNKVKLLSLQRRCRRYLDILVGVHGHQIFESGCFNGDPHPGNCLELQDGRLGLIDYGQTRRLSNEERLALSGVVVALENGSEPARVAAAMRSAGFETKNPGDDEILVKYATLFFDSDLEAKQLGFATPQLYFASLMSSNALTKIPDSAIFVARVSFLFRGMGGGMGTEPVRTSKQWAKHAEAALARAAR